MAQRVGRRARVLVALILGNRVLLGTVLQGKHIGLEDDKAEVLVDLRGFIRHQLVPVWTLAQM